MPTALSQPGLSHEKIYSTGSGEIDYVYEPIGCLDRELYGDAGESIFQRSHEFSGLRALLVPTYLSLSPYYYPGHWNLG